MRRMPRLQSFPCPGKRPSRKDDGQCDRREDRRDQDGDRIDAGLGNADHEGEHELRAPEQEVVLAEVAQALQPEGVEVRGRDEASAQDRKRTSMYSSTSSESSMPSSALNKNKRITNA